MFEAGEDGEAAGEAAVDDDEADEAVVGAGLDVGAAESVI